MQPTTPNQSTHAAAGRTARRLASALLTWTLGAACCWPVGAASPVGQWVWSRRDLPTLEQARRVRPDVAAAVNIADLSWDGQVRTRLRLPPGLAGPPAMLVVRLDNSFHHAVPEPAGAQLNQALGRLLAAVDPALAALPVELDYDAPITRLPVYAAWLDTFRAGALQGRAVWITTLPSQLRDPGFGARFASRVDGIVPQVFDTGEPWTPQRAASLAADLARAAIPFALGLGGFDRPGTRHAAWLAALPTLAELPTYRGTCVFPAGFDWSPLLKSIP
ncbi:DUF3142 domain-containing protein [uncultured Thiodictyon sp.]|uniref:DUF3142 domain-containing protein n=1 Tax=uncultured Thiodictyon sp. TaxID=1846217 RepID=UPI0025F4ED2F|nr:DUF3142 domain-containing protein [uncultured Thiodictyon sp.]